MGSVASEFKGIDKLLAKLAKLGKTSALRPATQAAALHIKGKVDKYPPSTSANSPDNESGRWYERGYGSKWRRKDGSVNGRKTSETLGRKWTTQIIAGGASAIVGNNVSYGPYVQDEEHQTSFHQARGWKTIQTISREEADTIMRFYRQQIERILSEP